MPSIPVLMVQYVNDATEIRYSDGSRLELSPCGSVFQFEAPRSESRHPIQGADVIQQRSAFVTSQHRDKLLEALDFRNRFAERPFLCQDLFNKEDIVLLYSNIVETAWPKTADASELLPDGGFKLTSQDEFASLVLSPHGRDFTVCYLSKTSISPPSQLGIPKRQHSSPAESRSRHVSGGSNSGVSDKSDGSYKLRSKTSRKRHSSKRKHKGSQFGCLTVEPSANSAFVTVTQRHHRPQHQRQSSNPKLSDGESSTHSVQSFDSITSSVEDELCSSYRELNIQAAGKSQNIGTASTSVVQVPKSHSRSHHIHQSNHLSHHISPNISPISRDLSHLGPVLDGAVQGDSQSKSRQYYCWVTQHVSCADCPSYWSHPAMLLQQRWEQLRKEGIKTADDNHNDTNSKNNNDCMLSKTKLPDQRDTTQIHSQDSACMCELPPPVPLTCPGQHLHSWSQSYDLDTNSYCSKVKVVMSEGVIYRLVGRSSLHQIEIYPGDNSVLASQGLTGHFFVHVLPRGDNSLVDEKTYSVKVPPLDVPGSPYSLAKLITRGAEYLTNQQAHIQFKSENEACCWKHKEEITMSDNTNPALTVRCEHNVQGLGKFLAYTNGKIRIVFTDRTALDMLSDIGYHSNSPGCRGDTSKVGGTLGSILDSHKAKLWGELIPAGHCRLLLPSGRYQTVPLDSPGQFKMYVDYAREWSAWVNTPASERANFYSSTDNVRDLSPDTELRKINCFNYVVENTVLKQQSLAMDQSGDGHHFTLSDRLCYGAPQSLPVPSSTKLFPSDQIQSFDDVRRALQKTSRAIHEIDSLLSTRK